MAASQPTANNTENMAPTPASSDQAVVCVFCGASPGTSPAHMDAARALANTFHKNNIKLVYGGGTVGIMGELAKTLVSLSGPQAVHGIIPSALLRYERKPDSTTNGDAATNMPDESVYGRTTVVPDMHTRKQTMASEVISGGTGSGFVALSGGYGTLEELMEVVTWNQLGIHARPVVVFNVEGYWDGLLQWVKKAVESGFIGEGNKGIMVEAKEAGQVIERLGDYETAEGRFKLQWGEK
ncbi:uncharacterized protein LTR77_002729 [Saxophila tyrrhenica]|uniref:Lysine decarboxylase-like protein-like protein n=1 Tax=Saxophila tyrrhenica TaxID=1690608 RepID=A0AAV9PI75_9PEZI|nr:hypothetical protein LTR77_002729 [Saxophila tyrrhenica]